MLEIPCTHDLCHATPFRFCDTLSQSVTWWQTSFFLSLCLPLLPLSTEIQFCNLSTLIQSIFPCSLLWGIKNKGGVLLPHLCAFPGQLWNFKLRHVKNTHLISGSYFSTSIAPLAVDCRQMCFRLNKTLMQRQVPRVRRLFRGLCAAHALAASSLAAFFMLLSYSPQLTVWVVTIRLSQCGAFAWLMPRQDMMVKSCTAVSPLYGHSAGEHVIAHFSKNSPPDFPLQIRHDRGYPWV